MGCYRAWAIEPIFTEIRRISAEILNYELNFRGNLHMDGLNFNSNCFLWQLNSLILNFNFFNSDSWFNTLSSSVLHLDISGVVGLRTSWRCI